MDLPDPNNAPPAWLTPIAILGTIFQFFFNSVISVVLYRMGKSDRGREWLEQELQSVATKLVEERFRSMSHEVSGEVAAFKATLESLSKTVEKAEDEFDQLWDGDKAIEGKLIDKLHQMQIENMKEIQRVLDRVATKEDLKRLREEVLKHD